MTIEYLSLFVSWVDSFLILPLHHLHNSIVSYQNARMDKRFFKSWVLHIPHLLRDLLWMVRACSSVAPIFSSLIMSWASSSSQSLLKVITSRTHSSNEWIPWSWEAIHGGYHNFFILHFFYHFKLLFDLRDPCKEWLYALYIMDLQFLQLVSWGHLLIYVHPFKLLGQGIKYLFRCL